MFLLILPELNKLLMKENPAVFWYLGAEMMKILS